MSNSANTSKQIKTWSYSDAQKTTKYVQLCLNDLRISIIKLRHLYRAHKFNRAETQKDPDFADLIKTGKQTFSEFNELNILIYNRAYRGIALFPFVVLYDDGIGQTPRNAFYIYKDTRTTIDHYIFQDELEAHDDMPANEKIIPENWKNDQPIIKISKK